MNTSNAFSNVGPTLPGVLSTLMGTIIMFAIGLAALTLLAG